MRSLTLATILVCVAGATALAQPGMELAASASASAHHGFTAELNLGVGFAEVIPTGTPTYASKLALAGRPDVGLGGWLTPCTSR